MFTAHQMEKINVIRFTIFAVFFLVVPGANCEQLRPPHDPHPLCLSQIALVNYACAKVPLYAAPSLPSANLFPTNHDHGHEHGSSVQENCCRWLHDVDIECVCEQLVHLPPFLQKRVHSYTVIVGSSCRVTYPCGGKKL